VTTSKRNLISRRSAANRFSVKIIALAVIGALSVLAAQTTRAQVTGNGGCNTYEPIQGATVTCSTAYDNEDSKGVQAPQNTTVNNVTVIIEPGVVLDISGSTVGLGNTSTVKNQGTLNTRSFFNGYGISSGVNGRSGGGGNTFLNDTTGVIETGGTNGAGMVVNATLLSSAGNSVTNSGRILTSGSSADGIRLISNSTQSVQNIVNNTSTGIIRTGGALAQGINIRTTATRVTIVNDGEITVTGASAYGVYVTGAAELTVSGTVSSSDSYAVYFDPTTSNTLSNTVTLKSGADLIGGIAFDVNKTSEKLVFDGFVAGSSASFDNSITGVNLIEAINNTNVVLGASGYSFGDSSITVDATSTLQIDGGIAVGSTITKLGEGDLILNAENQMSSVVTVSAGALQLNNNLAAGTGQITIADSASLKFGANSLNLPNNIGLTGTGTIATQANNVTLTGLITGGSLSKTGSGVLTLANGSNTYSGGTTITEGTLALTQNNSAGTGEVVMAANTVVQADANLTLDNVFKLRGPVEFNTQGFDLRLNNTLSNNSVGQLIKTGSGTLTLNGTNDYSGGTIIEQGAIALYGSLASGVEIQAATVLGGSGTVTGDVSNAGIVQPRINGQRSTLTIVGNYVGQNGTFASTLGGATNDIEADQLEIQGAGNVASGNTSVSVSDPTGVLGKPTVGDGILLVDVSAGATTTSTAFSSPRIAAGAYEYTLVKGGDDSAESWYLRADQDEPQPPVVVTPEASQREEVALYPSLPSLARQYLWSINGTLDDRRGAPDVIGQWDTQPMAWARLIAQRNETKPGNVNDGPGLKANDWGLQLGADLWRSESDWGQWRAGPVMTIGRSTGGAYNTTGTVQTGDVSLNAYSLGLNATVASDHGAYADLLLLGTRLTGVQASSPLGTSINTTGWAFSGSIEGGWRIPLNDKFAVTPQAQIYTTTVNLQDSADAYSLVQMPTETTVLGRVGLKLSYDNIEATGPRTQLWARASVYSTLSGKDASTSFLNVVGTNPTTFQSQAPDTWMALEAAVNVQATDSTSVQLGLGYQTTFDNQYRGIYGQINVRVGF